MLRKQWLNPSAWLEALARARPGHIARAGAGGLYLIVTLLAVMELASPGSVERIAEQPAGCVLLLLLAGGLGVIALFELSAALLGMNDAPTHDSGHALNAFLHGALAAVAVAIALGGGEPPGRASGATLGALALVLIGGGAYELFSLREVEGPSEGLEDRRRLFLHRRDLIVRGMAFAVLGGALFKFALPVALGDAVVPLERALSDTGWMIAAAVALAAYGVHALAVLAEPESSRRAE